MHRKGEGAMTLGTRDSPVSAAASLDRPALRLREAQQTTDRLYSICRDAFPGNARQPSFLAFLPSELR